ncbi:MAG: hypothetical protein JSS66_09530 [Armatimonadetes bacterium]|nr:hypothetical protein [Armatimonadota bacterium]
MILSALIAASVALAPTDELPDVSLLPSYLSQAFVTTNNPELPVGTRALRFPTASVNLGQGRLELRGSTIVGDKQLVKQRIYRTDGSWWERDCGYFIYHPQHQHIHFEDWTQFLLREMNPDGSVGAVVATGSKTSFCILEIVDWDPSKPHHYESPSYGSCGQIQGLRPGWSDVYGSSLSGQYIDLTGVPDGRYYLVGYIDPNSQVLESNEHNNVVKIPFNLGTPPAVQPDAYEDNDSRAQVDAMPEGVPNSSNFGKVKRKMIKNLTMDDTDDYFKFKLPSKGGETDYVKIESPWMRQGDLNLQLLNESGQLLASSSGSYNFEQISLKGRPAATYYVRVLRNGSTNNPEYWLTINQGGSLPPAFELTEPKAAVTYVEHSYQTIPMKWSFLGPARAQSISVFKTKTGSVDDGIAVDGYEGLPGWSNMTNVLTNQFDLGKWYVYARATSGEALTDSFAPGPVIVYLKGDTNFDGEVTYDEAKALKEVLDKKKALPDGWEVICDMDYNRVIDYADYFLMLKRIEAMDHHRKPIQ